MRIIADTSYVIAVTITTDKDHERCAAIHKTQNDIVLPQSTLAEVMYLLTKHVGNLAASRFLRLLPRSKYRVIPLSDEDIARTAAILDQYSDSRVDFVDASVIAVAERLNIARVLTLDRRDFDMVRPSHIPHFELLPTQ
jgi:predicted nucleic acid-binding protein